MTVKEQLFAIFVKAGDDFVSGAKIAQELGVTRNAVWKAVESLRKDGYEIEATPNIGYKLADDNNILSSHSISRFIKTKDIFHFDVRKSLSSTNTILREIAATGAGEGYVLVADEQTAGKGRMGRSFHSPSGCGIYFSILLRPKLKKDSITYITPAAAVSVWSAIQTVTGIDTGIKWVNDLIYNGKKVCGILTEATFDMESGAIDEVVLGIGINVASPKDGYPDELDDKITALFSDNTLHGNIRSELIAATLDNFWNFYSDLNPERFIDIYKNRSTIIGHAINIISPGEITKASALDIDDECRLIVKYENGEIATLNAGEVSIRSG